MELPMLPTYVLARDHLQRAATILQGADGKSRQIRYIIERTISLMEELRPPVGETSRNVVDFSSFRRNKEDN